LRSKPLRRRNRIPRSTQKRRRRTDRARAPTEARRQIELFLNRAPPAVTGDAAERFKDYLKTLSTDADATFTA
jgi:hypothetical protein